MPIDYSIYPPNWSSEIRPRILTRANNCCEECTVENYSEGIRSLDSLETLEQYMIDCSINNEKGIIQKYGKNHDKLKLIKIVLSIAHLDHDPENWDVEDDRLKALCQRCHLRYDAKEKAKKRREKKYKDSLFPVSEVHN